MDVNPPGVGWGRHRVGIRLTQGTAAADLEFPYTVYNVYTVYRQCEYPASLCIDRVYECRDLFKDLRRLLRPLVLKSLDYLSAHRACETWKRHLGGPVLALDAGLEIGQSRGAEGAQTL